MMPALLIAAALLLDVSIPRKIATIMMNVPLTIVTQLLVVILNHTSIVMIKTLVPKTLVIVVLDVLTKKLYVMITVLVPKTLAMKRKDVFTQPLIAMIRMIVLMIPAAQFMDVNMIISLVTTIAYVQLTLVILKEDACSHL